MLWMLAAAAWAQSAQGTVAEPPPNRLVYLSTTSARANAPWASTQFELVYRRRMYESPAATLAGNGIEVGVTSTVASGLARGGALVRIQPLTLLRFEATVEGVGSYGALGHLASFSDAGAAFGPVTRKGRDVSATAGWVASVAGTFQVKLGPFGVSSVTRAARWDLDLPSGDTTFYEPAWDLLVADGGWALTEDAVLVALLGQPSLGLRYTLGHAFHGQADTDGDQTTHRLGPFVSWTFTSRPGASFDRPTVFAMAQWHLDHPYRAGGEVAAVVPLLMVGFSFTGDLLPWQRDG